MAKKGFKSIIFGILTGATLGLLFSPDKGSKIRTKLSKQARKNKHVSSLLDKAICGFKDLICTAKKELKKAIGTDKKDKKTEDK